MRGIKIGATILAIITIACALIAYAVPAWGASPGKVQPGEVLCHTFSPGPGNDYVLGRCTDKAETGGFGDVNFGKLFNGFGYERIRWASGKVTIFQDRVQEAIAACGTQYDDYWQIQGGISKDTTGSITAPVDLQLCGPEPSWVLQAPAQI